MAPKPRRAEYRHLRADLPFVKVSALRKAKIITHDMTEAEIECGGLKRPVKLWHMHFPWNGGSWSYFLCPHCGRKCQILRLYDGRFTCRLCDGLARERGKSTERLRQTLAKPSLHMRRQDLEISLRRALVAKRRDKLKGWRKP